MSLLVGLEGTMMIECVILQFFLSFRSLLFIRSFFTYSLARGEGT